MLFDIFIPSLNIIFEYHGYQHYFDHCLFGDVKSKKERDDERSEACNFHGITYVEVPYWWKRDKESIIAILHRFRPDIVPEPMATPFQYPIKQKPNKSVDVNCIIKPIHGI